MNIQHDAHVMAYCDEKPIMVRPKFLDKLFDQTRTEAFEKGRAQGERECTSLELRDTCDARSRVHIITATSRRALSREVAKRNHREDTGCGYDCTGRAFAWSCELLRAYRDGNRWFGVCVSSTYYDV